jgi:glycosyltransferase involved in cell wall biosynthesis
MRIGILSYPQLFQRDPALQRQVRETLRALVALGQYQGVPLEAALIDPDPTHLDSYDVVHVFSASGSNGRIVEAAAELGLAVVLSPLIAPGWDRHSGAHARLADHRMGRQTAWSVQSNYAQTRRALQLAGTVVALGAGEREAIAAGFLIDPAKVCVVPNGVNPQLFDADGALFRLRTGIHGDFVLMAGPIAPLQDQLGMARRLRARGVPLVLLGEARERDQQYLQQVRAVGGVTCLGGLQHDGALLASAYAAASALVLQCRSDACARTAFDALAAGTPVVTSVALEVPGSAHVLRQVAHGDSNASQQALLALLAAPPAPATVRAVVRPYTWQRAAVHLASCYLALAERDQAGGASSPCGQGVTWRVSAS